MASSWSTWSSVLIISSKVSFTSLAMFFASLVEKRSTALVIQVLYKQKAFGFFTFLCPVCKNSEAKVKTSGAGLVQQCSLGGNAEIFILLWQHIEGDSWPCSYNSLLWGIHTVLTFHSDVSKISHLKVTEVDVWWWKEQRNTKKIIIIYTDVDMTSCIALVCFSSLWYSVSHRNKVLKYAWLKVDSDHFQMWTNAITCLEAISVPCTYYLDWNILH